MLTSNLSARLSSVDGMEPAQIVAIVVAVIAALASITGARFARSSAKHAQESARLVNGVNQRVAALDRDADELRAAYKEAVNAVANFQSAELAIPAGASLEVLAACKGASFELQEVALRLQEEIGNVMGEYSSSREGFGEDMRALRLGYRSSQQSIAIERLSFFERSESELTPRWFRFIPN